MREQAWMDFCTIWLFPCVNQVGNNIWLNGNTVLKRKVGKTSASLVRIGNTGWSTCTLMNAAAVTCYCTCASVIFSLYKYWFYIHVQLNCTCLCVLMQEWVCSQLFQPLEVPSSMWRLPRKGKDPQEQAGKRLNVVQYIPSVLFYGAFMNFLLVVDN